MWAGPLLLASPTAAQLRGRTYYEVYGTAQHSFEYPYFADRRLDSLFSEDVISISINGGMPGRLYFYEQSASYVVFPAETAYTDAPAGVPRQDESAACRRFWRDAGRGRCFPRPFGSYRGFMG